jgi:hypothetical protein
MILVYCNLPEISNAEVGATKEYEYYQVKSGEGPSTMA